MASIQKRGNRWQVRWRNRGDPKNRGWSTLSRADAKDIKLAAELAHARGEAYFGPGVAAAAGLDLWALAKTYLKDLRRTLAPKSAEQVNIALTQFLWNLAAREPDPDHRPPLPPSLLGAGRSVLSSYHDYLRFTRGCSVGTANMRTRFVMGWWAWMAEEHDEIPRAKTIRLASPIPPPPPAAPTWAEMDAAILCAPSWYARLFAVMRFTGLRTTQAMRLRRDDVDLEAKTLRVRPELGKSRPERLGRVVPVSAHLCALIATWAEDGDFLVTIPPHVYWGPPRRVAQRVVVIGAWKRAKVRPEVWSARTIGERRTSGHPLHCFRAGFITGLQALGVPEADVQVLVGHHTGNVTRERYTDPAQVRRLRAAVDTIPAMSAGAAVIPLGG